MDSPIKRVGGKKLLRKIITERFPNHICYVEPFFGAGWVYFHKEPSKIEVINDIDDNVINFFDVLKNKQEEFLKEIEFNLYSRVEFNRIIKADISSLSAVQKAKRFWYLIQYSFGAKCTSYGYRIVGSGNPNLSNMLERIKVAHLRLQNTNIENKSFEDIMPRYDRDHTFFYCDPPYFCQTGYDHKFGYREHEILSELLSNLKGKFLLSINDCAEARGLYGRFNVDIMSNIWGLNKGQSKKVCELIVTNY